MFTRFRLLAASMAPLLVILSVRTWSAHCLISVCLAVAAVLSVLSLVAFLRARQDLGRSTFTLFRVKDETDQIPAYLVTYLVPFVTISSGGWLDVAAYALFAAVLMLVVVRTDLIYVQPLLLVIGWRLFRVEIENGHGREYVLVSKIPLSTAVRVETISLGGDYAKVTKVEE